MSSTTCAPQGRQPISTGTEGFLRTTPACPSSVCRLTVRKPGRSFCGISTLNTSANISKNHMTSIGRDSCLIRSNPLLGSKHKTEVNTSVFNLSRKTTWLPRDFTLQLPVLVSVLPTEGPFLPGASAQCVRKRPYRRESQDSQPVWRWEQYRGFLYLTTNS